MLITKTTHWQKHIQVRVQSTFAV